MCDLLHAYAEESVFIDQGLLSGRWAQDYIVRKPQLIK